jgi:hypothetical protein
LRQPGERTQVSKGGKEEKGVMGTHASDVEKMHGDPELASRRRWWPVVGSILASAVCIAVAVHVHSRNAVALASVPGALQKKGTAKLFRGAFKSTTGLQPTEYSDVPSHFPSFVAGEQQVVLCVCTRAMFKLVL